MTLPGQWKHFSSRNHIGPSDSNTLLCHKKTLPMGPSTTLLDVGHKLRRTSGPETHQYELACRGLHREYAHDLIPWYPESQNTNIVAQKNIKKRQEPEWTITDLQVRILGAGGAVHNGDFVGKFWSLSILQNEGSQIVVDDGRDLHMAPVNVIRGCRRLMNRFTRLLLKRQLLQKADCVDGSNRSSDTTIYDRHLICRYLLQVMRRDCHRWRRWKENCTHFFWCLASKLHNCLPWSNLE